MNKQTPTKTPTTYQRIYTRCPARHSATLTINRGHLLCTWYACPNPTLIDQADELLKERDTQHEQVTKLREALEYIGGRTEHGHEGTIVPCRICATVDKALAETEMR